MVADEARRQLAAEQNHTTEIERSIESARDDLRDLRAQAAQPRDPNTHHDQAQVRLTELVSRTEDYILRRQAELFEAVQRIKHLELQVAAHSRADRSRPAGSERPTQPIPRDRNRSRTSAWLRDVDRGWVLVGTFLVLLALLTVGVATNALPWTSLSMQIVRGYQAGQTLLFGR